VTAAQPAAVTLGGFEISVIREAAYWWDGGAIFGVVPKTLWSRKAAADDLNRIELAFNCYLLRTGEHTILIETGGGDKMNPRARERMNLPPLAEPFPSVVERHGFDPEAIDIVITATSTGTIAAAIPCSRAIAPRLPFREPNISLRGANGSTLMSGTRATG
jgi:hypothetical protein